MIKLLLVDGVPGKNIRANRLAGFDECKNASDFFNFKKCLNRNFKMFDKHFGVIPDLKPIQFDNYLYDNKEYLYYRFSQVQKISSKKRSDLLKDKYLVLDMRNNYGGYIKHLNEIMCDILLIEKCPKTDLIVHSLLRKIIFNSYIFNNGEVLEKGFTSISDVYNENSLYVYGNFKKVNEIKKDRKEMTVIIDQNCFSACASMASYFYASGFNVCSLNDEFQLVLSDYSIPQAFELPYSKIRFVVPTMYFEYRKESYKKFIVKKCKNEVSELI